MQNFNFDDYDFKRNLILCWPTGTGKTYKATELLQRYKKTKSEPHYLHTFIMKDAHFKQIVKANMSCLRKPEEYVTSLKQFPLELLLRCELLLYDDIGVSDPSDAYIRDLTYVLDERMEKWKPIIYTTNLNKDQLKAQLNERILSRMLYNADVVVIDGEDRRVATTRYFKA